MGEAYQQGRYAEAPPLDQQANDLARRAFGPKDRNTLISLDNLVLLYRLQGRYWEGEPLYERALQLRCEVLGEDHPDTIPSLSNLVMLYCIPS